MQAAGEPNRLKEKVNINLKKNTKEEKNKQLYIDQEQIKFK